jgi:hypothetical protein
MSKQVISFADNPNNKTITAFFEDGTSLLLKQISYENYTNPPGWKDKITPVEKIKEQLVNRKLNYYTALNTELAS